MRRECIDDEGEMKMVSQDGEAKESDGEEDGEEMNEEKMYVAVFFFFFGMKEEEKKKVKSGEDCVEKKA